MSRQAFQVAYHIGAADDHTMEVEALAPALLALGKLVREANTELNGNRAKVKVLVTSDFEHKCFQINFEVVQTALQYIRSLLDDDNVKTATELLKTIGIVGGAAGSLIGFLKFKKGRNVAEATRISDTTAEGSVVLNLTLVGGENNKIQISDSVFRLSKNKKILDALSETLSPIENDKGSKIEFKQDDQPTAVFSEAEVKEIIASCDVEKPSELPEPDDQKPITANLRVYSPVYDPKAKLWRFMHGKQKIYADISETSIAKDALERGGAFVDDRYRVRMTPPATDSDEHHHKVVEVLGFTPAARQKDLPLAKPVKKRTRKKK